MSELHQAQCSCGWRGEFAPLLEAESQAYKHEREAHPPHTLKLVPAFLASLVEPRP